MEHRKSNPVGASGASACILEYCARALCLKKDWHKKKNRENSFSRESSGVECGAFALYSPRTKLVVVGGHHCHNLEQHILRVSELLARRRRRARVFARQFWWQSGVLQRQYTGAFEAHRGQIDRLVLLGARNL